MSIPHRCRPTTPTDRCQPSTITLVVLLAFMHSACIAHAPESVAGPDSVLVSGAVPTFPVTVEEDQWGIPHIRARSDADAAFALGLLHAEERLWQMDINRRAGMGRLSEFFGARTLPTDRFLRTVGFEEAARSALAALPSEELALLEAYASGVNSHIEGGADLPPEYRIVGSRPEPWTPLHSVLWTKSMSWLLSASAGTDALYEQLIRSQGETVANLVVPNYPQDGPRILPPDQMQELRSKPQPIGDRLPSPPPPLERQGQADAPRTHEALVLLNEILGAGPDVGSNNWVVHGSRTNTQAPLLSNDPHLGVQVPSIWYLAEIDTPQQHVIGATMPGMPGIVIGHNEDIAWGLTNLGADVMDLFLERIDPGHPEAVLRLGGREDLEVIEHEISVRGRAKPTHLTVRRSSNGPLVTEFFPDLGDEVALRWTALEDNDRTFSAFLALGRASDWQEFLAALRLFAVPCQNFVYADRAGHIGWKAPGLIPVRRGFRGDRPARGWLDEAWEGFIPFDELPEAFDPVQGWIASANNHPVPPDYPHHLGSRFAQPYRAMRIIDLLEQGAGRTFAGHRAMQLDTLSAQVDDLLPLLLGSTPQNEIERRAMELLNDWEGEHDVDSGAAAVYNAWMVEVADLLTTGRFGAGRASRVRGLNGTFLRNALTGPGQKLCSRDRTRGRPALADCSELTALALSRATTRLRREMGKDVSSWTWGAIHKIHYHHRLALLPHLKAKLDTIRPSAGGPHTLNIGSYNAARSFTQTWFPSYRQVIDLSDWNKSRWIHSPGQSGVPWRAHYRDLVDPYLLGDMLPMAFGREAVLPFLTRTRQIRR